MGLKKAAQHARQIRVFRLVVCHKGWPCALGQQPDELRNLGIRWGFVLLEESIRPEKGHQEGLYRRNLSSLAQPELATAQVTRSKDHQLQLFLSWRTGSGGTQDRKGSMVDAPVCKVLKVAVLTWVIVSCLPLVASGGLSHQTEFSIAQEFQQNGRCPESVPFLVIMRWTSLRLGGI